MLHNLLQFGFAGFAGICLLGAFLRRAHRGSFVVAAICAGSAAVATHYDVFWAIAVSQPAAWVFGAATLLLWAAGLRAAGRTETVLDPLPYRLWRIPCPFTKSAIRSSVTSSA